jgi:hypothetical protein
MVLITAVHMEGGSSHEHVGKVRWRYADDEKIRESTRDQMVEYINGNNLVMASDGVSDAVVVVFEGRYLRTNADEKWTDNLLALPRY